MSLVDDVETEPCPVCRALWPLTELFTHVEQCRKQVVESRISADLKSTTPKYSPAAVNFFRSAHAISHQAYPLISCILDGRLFLGSAAGASDLHQIRQNGIRCIVNCGREIDPFSSELQTTFGLTHYLKLAINDIPSFDISQHLHRGADFIHSVISASSEASPAVFVHCAMGVSRSTSILLAYLVKYENMRLIDALLLVQSKRSCIYPNHGFLRQLIQFEHELASSRTNGDTSSSLSLADLELHLNST